MFDAFRSNFSRMVDALCTDPSIVVALVELLPPVPAEIAEVEARLGYSLGADITRFYSECGGIKLVWTTKEWTEDGIWEGKDALKAFANPAQHGPWIFKSGDLVGAPVGCIWIPSCKQVFGNPDQWSDLIGGQDDIFDDYRDQVGDPADGVEERVVPFDYASSFYDFAFLMNGKPDPKIVRGEDNGACFSDSRLVSLPEYLDILIATKGNVELRQAALAIPDDDDDDDDDSDDE